MASYGYPSRGYSAYSDLTPWVNNGIKTSYAADHVCKPVIIDADGRKHPVVSYTPSNNPENRITETQTIVMQEVQSPFVNGYKHSSPEHGYGNTGYGHVKDTLFANGYKHSSPEHGHGYAGYGDVKDTPFVSGYKHSSPEHGHGYGNTGYRPVEDKWHGHGPGHGNTGYGVYSDESSKDWHKPSGHNGDYDNYYFPRVEPTVTTSGGWTRPTRAGWAVPPSHTSLSRPTNDINTAVGYFQESARPTSVTTAPRSRVTVPITTGPRRDDYGQTIDSRKATRRYANLRSSPVLEEMYTGTIDSREAARKYGGAAV